MTKCKKRFKGKNKKAKATVGGAPCSAEEKRKKKSRDRAC